MYLALAMEEVLIACGPAPSAYRVIFLASDFELEGLTQLREIGLRNCDEVTDAGLVVSAISSCFFLPQHETKRARAHTHTHTHKHTSLNRSRNSTLTSCLSFSTWMLLEQGMNGARGSVW